MIRVAIADDQQLIRAGFRSLLEAEPDIEIVGEAGTGADAVAGAHGNVRDAAPELSSVHDGALVHWEPRP